MAKRQPSVVTRSLNDRLVIDLLLAHGPLDRPSLADLTGLSKPSIADLINRLTTDGFVEEFGETQSVKRGPNAMRYSLRSGLGAVAGVEVQPDHAQATIADVNGTVLGTATVTARGSEEPSRLVKRVLRKASSPSGVDITTLHGVVAGTPGIVDATGDITYVWGHPEWIGGQREKMQDTLGVPVSFENDTNLAAITEKRFGAASDVENFVLFRCGESVSAAIMLGSRLIRGARGAAGEIGYLPRLDVEPPDGQYNEGFQSFAGSVGLTSILDRLGVEDMSPARALTPGHLGSGLYKEFVTEIARRFAAGIISVCAVIDPELIVLDGEIAVAGGANLASAIQSQVERTSPFRPSIAVSEFGADAVVRGAVTTALDTARNEIYGNMSILIN